MSIVSGKRLKALREHAGKSQADIAQLLGITSQNVSAYERGREPSFDMLCVLVQFYGVTTDYILGLSDYENPAQKATLSSIDLIESIPLRLRQTMEGELTSLKRFLITAQEYCKRGLPAFEYPFVLATFIMRYAVENPTKDCMRGIPEHEDTDSYPVSYAAEFFACDCIESFPVRIEGYERIVERQYSPKRKKEIEDNSHAEESEQ